MSLIIDPYRFATGDTFVMPYRQDIMGWSSVDGSSGMTYTRVQSSVAMGGGLGGQLSLEEADSGDYMEWFVNLEAGTYTLTEIFFRSTLQGIVRWSLDGTSLGTIDHYGSSAPNIVGTITGITVPTAGNYTLRAAIDGKHASSTDYLMPVKAVNLTRTGA